MFYKVDIAVDVVTDRWLPFYEDLKQGHSVGKLKLDGLNAMSGAPAGFINLSMNYCAYFDAHSAADATMMAMGQVGELEDYFSRFPIVTTGWWKIVEIKLFMVSP